jgi:hypothetical protein
MGTDLYPWIVHSQDLAKNDKINQYQYWLAPESWHKTKSHIFHVSVSPPGPPWGTRDRKVGRQKTSSALVTGGVCLQKLFFSQNWCPIVAGFLVDFVSTPVISAYTSAASITIACNQGPMLYINLGKILHLFIACEIEEDSVFPSQLHRTARGQNPDRLFQ